MECKHPITNEWCQLTNKQWRCYKLMVDTNCTNWQLLAAERNHRRMFTIICERNFSDLEIGWLSGQLQAWPKEVTTSPQLLHLWFVNMDSFFHVATIADQLQAMDKLKARLAKMNKSKNVDAKRMVRAIQKQIAAIQKAKKNRRKLQKRRR